MVKTGENMSRKAFAVVGAMIAAIGLFGNSDLRAQESGIVRETGDFNERLAELGRVRGDIVMGAMIGTTQSKALADSLKRLNSHVEVAALPTPQPNSDPRQFCVRLNSKDGRFEAENTYLVIDDRIVPGGPFHYDGKYAGQVEEMATVALVAVGPCGNRIEAVVPSAWEETLPAPDDRALHLFVNAAGNLAFAEVGGVEVECVDVTDEDTLKYTAACILSASLLEEHRQDGRVPVTIYIARSLGEDKVDVTVIWPDEAL